MPVEVVALFVVGELDGLNASQSKAIEVFLDDLPKGLGDTLEQWVNLRIFPPDKPADAPRSVFAGVVVACIGPLHVWHPGLNNCGAFFFGEDVV